MPVSRRHLNKLALSAPLLAAMPRLGRAAEFPGHAVRFIVSWTPGGGADSLARLLSKGLTEQWKQPVVVENKPGADATIGIQALTMAPADGYTFAIIITSHAVHPSVRKALPYRFPQDFAGVINMVEAPNLLVVNPNLKVDSVRDLIALGKTRSLNFGAPGLGGPGHLGGVMFNMMAGIDAVHVPYAGGSPTLTAVMRGDVDFMFTTLLSGLPHAKSGRVKAIAITSANRSPLWPELPTVAESGLKGFELVTWYGIITRAGTPKPIVDRLAKDIAAVLAQPEVTERMAAEGMRVVAAGPDEFDPYLQSEVRRWASVVKQANIQPE